MIYTERIAHNGGLKLTGLVCERGELWYHTETFFGYTLAEAKKIYRARVKTNGWKLTS